MRYKKFIITGKVQNVGFREFLRKEASRLGGIAGYAKNLKNGNLEVLVAGDAEKIKTFEKACGRGPLLAQIKEVAAEEVDSDEEFDNFVIKY